VPPAQITGNDSMTLVNWPADKHAEIFVKTTGGELQHVYSMGTSDSWSGFDDLDTGAGCGFAAAFWPPPFTYAELFAPETDGSTGHLWWANNVWNTLQDYGGAGDGLGHFATLAWEDSHVEVFALGGDQAIWHNWWQLGGGGWAGWTSMGGTFVTGPAAILASDGNAHLFATDATGAVWHDSSAGGWQGFKSIGGSVASRPVPVRWADGHLEVFARGMDDMLYHAWTDPAVTTWQPFTATGGSTIAGEVSAIVNPKGNGASDGPEVFARDATGQVVHLWWNGMGWTDFTPHLSQIGRSDPFAWIRGDGVAEVFVIDDSGTLVRSYHDPNNGWTAWAGLGGSGLDPCVPALPPLPDGGSGATTTGAGTGGGRKTTGTGPATGTGSGAGGARHPAGSGSGSGKTASAGVGGSGGGGVAGGPMMNGDCSCRAGVAEPPPAGWSLAALAPLAFAGRRASNRQRARRHPRG
jgi:hypothetical protein